MLTLLLVFVLNLLAVLLGVLLAVLVVLVVGGGIGLILIGGAAGRRQRLPVLDPRLLLLPAVHAGARLPAQPPQITRPVPVEHWVLVNPEGPLPVNLAEVVEVQLAHQRLEPAVPEVGGQRLGFQPVQVRYSERVAAGQPLK